MKSIKTTIPAFLLLIFCSLIIHQITFDSTYGFQEKSKKNLVKDVSCGETITESTTLASNVGPCPVTGIIIGENDVTLDCNGKTISGSNIAFGILVQSVNGVTIKNCDVREFLFGVLIIDSNEDKIENNISQQNDIGFIIFNSDENKFTKNISNENESGGFWFL